MFVEIESLELDEHMRDRVGKLSKPVINISVGQHASSTKTTRLGYDVDILKGGDESRRERLGRENLKWRSFCISAADVDCNAGRVAIVITVPVLKNQGPMHVENDDDAMSGTATTTYAALALVKLSIPLAILNELARCCFVHRKFVRGEEHRSDATRHKSETGYKEWS